MGYIKMQKETRNFVSMANLRRALENDELDTSNDEVTFDYLCQEIKNLGQDNEHVQRQQAMWLMKFWRKQLQLHEGVPDDNEEHSALDGLKELIEQHLVLMADMLSAFRESKATQQQHMNNADGATLAQIGRQIEEVADNVAKVRRDQHGLAKRFEQLQSSILVGDRGQSSAPTAPKLRENKELRQLSPKDREHEDPSHDEHRLRRPYTFDDQPQHPRRLPGPVEQAGQEEQAFMTHEVSTNRRDQEKDMQKIDSTDHRTGHQRRPGQKHEHRGDIVARQRSDQQGTAKASGAGAKLRDKDKLLRR